MRRFITYTALASLLLTNFGLMGQQQDVEKWKLINKDKTFQLYARSNPISAIDEIRISFYVHSELDLIASVINDVDQYESWVYKCAKAFKKEILNENEYRFYLRTDFPFPLSDRHMLVHCKQEMQKDRGVYASYSRLAAADRMEEDGCEEMRYFKSSWKAKEITKGYYRIDYQVLADPSHIPAWLVNMAISKGPIESMKRFKQLVEVDTNNALTTVY